MKKPLIIIAGLGAIIGGSIGILSKYTDTNPDINTLISNNHKQWKSNFELTRDQLKKSDVNIPDWNEDTWNKWTSKLQKSVPKDLQHTIVNEVWSFAIPEMVSQKSNNKTNVEKMDLLMNLMNGNLKANSEEYLTSVNKAKEMENKLVQLPASPSPKSNTNGTSQNALSEEEVTSRIKSSYETRRKGFEDAIKKLNSNQKKDVPKWNDEIWKKAIARSYMLNEKHTSESVDQIWADAITEMFINKEKNHMNARLAKGMKFKELMQRCNNENIQGIEEESKILETLGKELYELEKQPSTH